MKYKIDEELQGKIEALFNAHETNLVEKVNTFAKELSFELATRPTLLSEEEREALTKLELLMGTIGKIVSGEDAYDLLIKEFFN